MHYHVEIMCVFYITVRGCWVGLTLCRHVVTLYLNVTSFDKLKFKGEV